MIRDPDLRDAVEQLRARYRIADILEQHGIRVRHLPNGSAWTLCPFHGERKPSFHITNRHGKERFHCWGCNVRGDVFDLVAFFDHHPNWKSTVRALADRHGIVLPERPANPGRRARWDVLALAASHYAECITADVLRYLESRGFPEPFVDEMGIGYAPAENKAGLAIAYAERGLVDAALEARVLSIDCQGEAQEYFGSMPTGYIIFPNRRGSHVVDLQGRAFPNHPKAPRYYTLPGPAFRLCNTNMLPAREVLVCEGCPDTLSARRAGIAACGVYGKNGWHGRYHRFFAGCERVYIAFDLEPEAQARAVEIARTFGPRGRVLIPPRELGPHGDLNDWFVRLAGRDPQRFNTMLAAAMRAAPSAWWAYIDHLKEAAQMIPRWELSPLVRPLLEEMAGAQDGVNRDVHLLHLAEVIAVPYRTLADECDRILRRDELDIDDEQGPADGEDDAMESGTEAGPATTAGQREQALSVVAPTSAAVPSRSQ